MSTERHWAVTHLTVGVIPGFRMAVLPLLPPSSGKRSVTDDHRNRILIARMLNFQKKYLIPETRLSGLALQNRSHPKVFGGIFYGVTDFTQLRTRVPDGYLQLEKESAWEASEDTKEKEPQMQ